MLYEECQLGRSQPRIYRPTSLPKVNIPSIPSFPSDWVTERDKIIDQIVFSTDPTAPDPQALRQVGGRSNALVQPPAEETPGQRFPRLRICHENSKWNTSQVHLTIKFNPNTSVVSLVVHRVTNLNETSHSFLPNPYVKTYLVEALYSSNVRDNYTKKKTKVKKSTVNPVFEDTLEYFIPQYNLK